MRHDNHLASNSIGVYIASCSVFQLAVVPDVGMKSLGIALSGLKIKIGEPQFKLCPPISAYGHSNDLDHTLVALIPTLRRTLLEYTLHRVLFSSWQYYQTVE